MMPWQCAPSLAHNLFLKKGLAGLCQGIARCTFHTFDVIE
jgi:hypothetical protein